MNPGPFPASLGKCPWPNLGKKKIASTSKLGEINDVEHYKGSKIYPQNQVILDCNMPSIPLKHKCLSIILIWVSVSHKWSLFFTFLNWENQTWYWEKRWLFLIVNGAEIWPLEVGKKGPGITYIKHWKKSLCYMLN